MNTDEMMAAMDAIIRRRSEGNLPLSELTPIVVKMFSAFHERHGYYLKSARDTLKELDDYLKSSDHERFSSQNPEFARYTIYSGRAVRITGSRKAVELSLGVNNTYLPQRTRLELVFQHTDKKISRHSDNDFNLDFHCNEPGAEKFARELLKHGFGSQETVEAIGEMLEENMKKLHKHMDKLQLLLDAKLLKYGRSLMEGKVACNLDAIETEQMQQLKGDDQIETLCMKTMDALKGKLDYITETLALLCKARETFYDIDDETVTRHLGTDNLFAVKWLGGYMSLSISVPEAKAGCAATFTARSFDPDDRTEWYADMDNFPGVLKDFLSCPRLDGHQKDSIPFMLEDALGELLDTCDHIRNRVEEKIEESV